MKNMLEGKARVTWQSDCDIITNFATVTPLNYSEMKK